jgi:hypothetical protein
LWSATRRSTLRRLDSNPEGDHVTFLWIIFPVLWIVGAIMEPTPAAAAESRASLQ